MGFKLTLHALVLIFPVCLVYSVPKGCIATKEPGSNRKHKQNTVHVTVVKVSSEIPVFSFLVFYCAKHIFWYYYGLIRQ